MTEPNTVEDPDRIAAAADRIIADPAFRRSPVMARLLRFLVAKTIERQPVKSYAIAFDGLGKQPSDQADADTYARVAVGRLRKALAAYHAAHPEADAIIIDIGSYEVQLIASSGAAASGVDGKTQPARSILPRIVSIWRRRIAAATIFAAIALLAWYVMAGQLREQEPPKASIWQTGKYPSLLVETVLLGPDTGDERIQLSRQQERLIAALSAYSGYTLLAADARQADFVLRLAILSGNEGSALSASLIDTLTGNLIWAKQFPLKSVGDEIAIASAIAVAVAVPSGALNGYLRRKGYDPQTPVGCWLQFTQVVQTLNSGTDEALRRCSHDWYAAAPNRRMAAFLYSWTLTDRGASARSDAERRAALSKAMSVVHRSIAVEPGFALLYLADMRTHAFNGDREQVRRSARQAIKAAKQNRMIIGLAASTLAMWNDPEGEAILNDLADSGGEASPWEQVGLFVAAMMRDDPIAAHNPALEIEEFEDSQPLLLLAHAAYCARVGKRAEAQATLARLRSNQGAAGGVDQVARRLPVAPEVAQRLREWIHSDRRDPARANAPPDVS